jgi:4-amino-4-deoxy-L-arabinose transferase-like glycosyltransferase
MSLKPSHRVPLVLALLTAWYLAATLTHLDDFPLLDWPQMGIVAPAAKLAEEGVYGNDLFEGFHGSESRNYEYMPAYPVLVAGAFKLFGTGVVQARLVSVLCGWLVVLLTFQLGRRLQGPAVGLIAAALLCLLRLGLQPGSSGVPLLDFARVIRYDVLVPVGVLAAALCFLDGEERRGRARALALLAAGAFAGLATLAHVYGVFVLAVFAAALLWQRGWRTLREAPLYLLAAGWLLAMLPWFLYVLQDPAAYAGQMSRHEGRFDFFSLEFYGDNLVREPWRYTQWLKGGIPETLLRPGIWLPILGLPAALALLWRRARGCEMKDRLLLLSLPVLALCLGLFLFMKRYAYTVLVLPFLALWLAAAIVDLWRWTAGRRGWRTAVVAAGILMALETTFSLARTLRTAAASTDYLELCAEIARPIPPGSHLLVSQPYWLGLDKAGSFEMRSVNLVFLLARTTTVDEALERLDPDGVVIESYFFDPSSDDPRGPPPDSESKYTFLEIAVWLDRHCGVTREIEDSGYGEVLTYLCNQGDR